MSYSLLFICTANICRSPMAEALWKEMLGQEQKDWRVTSAGTWAPEGEPAATGVRQVLEEKGIAIDHHRSRSVTRSALLRHRLILTMEARHKEALQTEFPEFADRVYLLSEMAGSTYDIQDPIGGSLEAYRAAAERIQQTLEAGRQQICKLSADHRK